MQTDNRKSSAIMAPAIISAVGAILAALIGLGGPLVESFVQKATPPAEIISLPAMPAASLPLTLEPSDVPALAAGAAFTTTIPGQAASTPTAAIPSTSIPASLTLTLTATLQPTATTPPTRTPTRTSTSGPTSTPPPALEAYTHATDIGTGIFADAYSSDGNEPIKKNKINSEYPDIQWIDRTTANKGCAKAKYDADLIWFNASGPTRLALNGVPVGELFASTGKHGFILDLPVKEDDELCVSPIPDGGFRIQLGPDMLYHYASFCYRGYCR